MVTRSFLLVVLSLIALLHAQDDALASLFSDLVNADKSTDQAVIAVMPLKASGQGISEDAGRVVAEYGVAFLKNSGRYRVVERAELAKAVDELKLAQSGLMDDKQSLKVGELLSANRLLVGTIADLFGRRMITARIVKTETGDIVSSASVTVPARVLDQFTKELLGERLQSSSTLFRSALMPGWGQFYTNHPIRGALSFTLFASTLSLTLYSAWQTGQAKTDMQGYHTFLKSADREKQMADRQDAGENWSNLVTEYNGKLDSYYSLYDDRYNKTVLWGLATGAVWLLNMGDAAIAARQAGKKYELYFSSLTQGTPAFNMAVKF